MKKKILLLCDDVRASSGVGRIAKELIVNTASRFNWVQLAAQANHEQNGQIIDVSESVNVMAATEDASVKLYANTGYGDEIILKRIIERESPDAVLHITDPRSWKWLYDMERWIRQRIPLCYYHVWDNNPPPKFNNHVYKSCDWIGCISRITYENVNIVDSSRLDWQTEYIPHGVCPQTYHPINDQEFESYKKHLLENDDYKFIVLANNLNISRKRLPSIISAFQKFGDMLPSENQQDILLILHTDPTHQHGTDLYKVVAEVCPNYNVIFSNAILEDKFLNYMYNIADVTINIASNEGFGLTTLESIMAGTPIIVSYTGGLIDQTTYPDETIGEWASVIKPSAKNLIGNHDTPYIYSDVCSEDSVVTELMHWYKTSEDERNKRGMLGREFAMNSLTNIQMCNKIADGLTSTIKKFVPKSRISLEVI